MTSRRIRTERPGDAPSIRRVVERAFGREGEARIVDALRANARLTLSLVAEENGCIVGHAAFSPVVVRDGGVTTLGLGLAPLSVLPSAQKRGVGSALVREALEVLQHDHPFVVLLGDPAFYVRFGFERATSRGIRWEHPCPDDAFMVRALQPTGLTGVRGVAAYCAELSAGSDKHGHPIDWELLRREIGAPTNLGGDSLAKLALARILGDESAIAAVRGYVQGDEANELARSVLWCLRPRAAILECERIFRASQDANRRRSAIELLRGMADGSVLAWLGEVFDDPDPGVRHFAVDLLRYLGHAGLTDLDVVAPHLVRAQAMADALPAEERDHLTEKVADIRSMFREQG